MLARRRTLCVGIALALLLTAACSRDDSQGTDSTTIDIPADDGSSTTSVAPAGPVLFSPEGNNLWAYEVEAPFRAQKVNTAQDNDPDGWDINGQICFLDATHFVAGEDTNQPDPPAGWAIFELSGERVGDFSIRRVEKLIPPFQPTDEHPDTIGCGGLSNGRFVTTTIGNSAAGTEDGELILWLRDPRGGHQPCILDVGIGTAQGITVSDGAIYVTSARGATAGVLRYPGPFPEAVSQCSGTDPGSGVARATKITREQLLRAGVGNPLISPSGIGRDPTTKRFYVSSVANGVIAEFTSTGKYISTLLEPEAGHDLADGPYPTGTPLGITVGHDGRIYYADLGLALTNGSFGPRSGAGTVRYIDFVDGRVQPPVTIADGRTFPDGLGLWYGLASNPALTS